MSLKSALGSELINGNSVVVDISANICMIGRIYKLVYETTWSNCSVLHQVPPVDSPTCFFLGAKNQLDLTCLQFSFS